LISLALFCWRGMATLTLALDGQKGWGFLPAAGALVALGVAAILWYLWHARGNEGAVQPEPV
jgi:DHA2 family multidrug resistance protein-like MFS transporter